MKVEIRCSECNKKLAVVDLIGTGIIETSCPRCKQVDNHAISLVPSKPIVEGQRSPSTPNERRRV